MTFKDKEKEIKEYLRKCKTEVIAEFDELDFIFNYKFYRVPRRSRIQGR